MENRKIIEFGKSSHVISLPKKWMEENRLSKGDIVTVEQSENKLVVRPFKDETKEESRRTEIDVTNMALSEIKVHLISKYIQNYNEITLTAKNMSAKAKDIRALVHDLMALEVIEETATKITTKDFLNMADIDPSELVRKMDALTREMLSDTKNIFKENKSVNIAERDGDVNRLFYLVRRSCRYIIRHTALFKKFGLTREEIITLWDITEYIETIADQTKRIANLMTRLKMAESEKKEFIVLFSSVERYYLNAMDMYNAKTSKNIAPEIGRAMDLMKKCQDYYRANWHTDWMPVIIEQMKAIIASTQAALMDISDVEFSERTSEK